jgi:hypothetical protein
MLTPNAKTLLACSGIAALSASLIAALHVFLPSVHSDFSVLWTAIKILQSGRNPYEVIGASTGFDYEFHHPLTSAIAVSPLALLPEQIADVVFVFAASFLFAFGALRDDWNRIWIFMSAAFVDNVKTGQLAPLIASVYYLPSAAILLPVKPSIGASLLFSSWTTARLAFLSGLSLLIISLVVFPDWISEWIRTTVHSWEYTSPIRRSGGFILVLSLLRWRTKEGKFLFLLSLIPQVSGWYEALLPMLVGRTKREYQVLSMVSSIGYLMVLFLALQVPERQLPAAGIGRLMIAFCYLPALIVVLRRPTEDRWPVLSNWFRFYRPSNPARSLP